MNIEEAFRYPVTLVSLSLAFPDSSHRENARRHFRYYLINVNKQSTPPNEACVRYYVSHENYQS